jgi:hypothetical protein
MAGRCNILPSHAENRQLRPSSSAALARQYAGFTSLQTWEHQRLLRQSRNSLKSYKRGLELYRYHSYLPKYFCVPLELYISNTDGIDSVACSYSEVDGDSGGLLGSQRLCFLSISKDSKMLWAKSDRGREVRCLFSYYQID